MNNSVIVLELNPLDIHHYPEDEAGTVKPDTNDVDTVTVEVGDIITDPYQTVTSEEDNNKNLSTQQKPIPSKLVYDRTVFAPLRNNGPKTFSEVFESASIYAVPGLFFILVSFLCAMLRQLFDCLKLGDKGNNFIIACLLTLGFGIAVIFSGIALDFCRYEIKWPRRTYREI